MADIKTDSSVPAAAVGMWLCVVLQRVFPKQPPAHTAGHEAQGRKDGPDSATARTLEAVLIA
jgi:hypothetical protein